MSMSIIWLAIRVTLELFSFILGKVKEKELKQLGRDEIVKEVIKEIKGAGQIARDASSAERDRIERDGLHSDDGFRGD